MAYKTFANGFPLPASDLNNYLMNQSVIVFADVAARGAALPTPVEGMITYLESDNQLYKWTGADWENVNDNADALPLSTFTAEGDLVVGTGASTATNLSVGGTGALLASNGTTPEWLAAGTNGYVLTMDSGEPTWAEASSGGLVTISSATLSGSSVSITSIPGTYKGLILQVIDASTDNDKINMQFNSDTGSAYSFVLIRGNSTAIQKASPSTFITLSGSYDNTTNINSTITIYNYATTDTAVSCQITGSHFDSSSVFNTITGSGSYQKTSAITSIQLFPAAGSFDNGSYVLYGVN